MILAALSSVPRWAWFALAVVLMVIGLLVYIESERDEAVSADRAQSNAEVLGKARDADERAQAAAMGKADEVRRSNAEAEAVARESDDPLADGLRALRN